MPFKKGQSGNPAGAKKKVAPTTEPIKINIKDKLEENLVVFFKALERVEKVDNRTLEIILKGLDLAYCKKNHKAIEEKMDAPGRVAVLTLDNGRSLLSYKADPRPLINCEDAEAYLNARDSGLLDKLKKLGIIHDEKVKVEAEPELLEKLKEMGIVDKDIMTSGEIIKDLKDRDQLRDVDLEKFSDEEAAKMGYVG